MHGVRVDRWQGPRPTDGDGGGRGATGTPEGGLGAMIVAGSGSSASVVDGAVDEAQEPGVPAVHGLSASLRGILFRGKA